MSFSLQPPMNADHQLKGGGFINAMVATLAFRLIDFVRRIFVRWSLMQFKTSS